MADRKPMTKEQKIRFYEYQKEFIKETYTHKNFRLHKTNDADIIEWLNGMDNFTSYLKGLVREDMKKQKRKKRLDQIQNNLQKNQEAE